MKLKQTFVYALLTVFACMATPAWSADTRIIRAAGSSTIRPVVSDAAALFEKKHPVVFQIEGGGSSHGVKTVASGLVDLGNASRNLKPSEAQQWPELQAHTIGYDGVAMIVHKDVGIDALSKENVQALYTGKIQNWQELGGADLAVKLISKESGRSTLDLFLKYAGLEVQETDDGMMVHRVEGETAYSDTKARIVGANNKVLLQVAWKPGSIGYVSIGAAKEFEKQAGKIILPSLDGIEATIDNVKNGTFPITRPLNVCTKGDPQGMVKTFVDFLLSAEGQKVVTSHVFVPVK